MFFASVFADRIRRAIEDPSGLPWLHQLPLEGPLDREDFVLDLARGRRVAYLGFLDEPLLAEKVASGRWLHSRVADAALELVGIDIELEGVAWARAQGYEAFVADCQDGRALAELAIAPVELVVAGEIIEHLEAPGTFLRACHALVEKQGRIVVTTPNAATLLDEAEYHAGTEKQQPEEVEENKWMEVPDDVLLAHPPEEALE
jgi:SAM-dependent methyltransferase